MSHPPSRSSFLILILLLGTPTVCQAAPREIASPAEVLPGSVVLYAEVGEPVALGETLAKHPIVTQAKALPAWKKLSTSPDFAKGMVGLAMVEFKLGMTWQKALTKMTAQGLTFAIDAESKGAMIFAHAQDEELLTKIRETFLEMARADAKGKGKPDPIKTVDYRGVTVYQAKDFGFVQLGEWLLIGNHGELGKKVLDRILDDDGDSLAETETFQMACSGREESPLATAWGYLNLAAVRRKNPDHDIFQGKVDDPPGEILLGGVIETLGKADVVTAELYPSATGISLDVAMPFDPETVSEARAHYFGPQGQGMAAPALAVPGVIASVSTYRNFSEMWLRAGELFPERVVDKMIEAESNLTTLFSGRDFGEEVLGSLGPQVQVLVAQQQYGTDGQPVPEIKLPAFALVFPMKEPEQTWSDLRRNFQNLIGFLNVTGAQNGNPQLDLLQEQTDDGEIVSAMYVRPTDEDSEDPVSIHYNFSPTVASANGLFVLSSTRQLAATILSAEPVDAAESDVGTNTTITLQVPQLRTILIQNIEQLIAQNMLEKGHTRQEAENEVTTLLDLLGLLDHGSLTLRTTADELLFQFGLDAKQVEEERDE
ncbi:MAG: hypothetical protein KDA80_08170 [Planctomycetaceae bacterium]|nr:hypothetical protein [Planctomycetaceae bacterium]